MESLRDEGSSAVPSGVVCRTREVTDVSYRAFLDAFDPPRSYWATPDGLEVAGAGAAAVLSASGPDRFDDLRAAADRLFASVDAPGPEAARPRLFGGAAFHADHDPAPPWRGFPAARFVLPRVQLVRTDDRTLVTVVAAGSDRPAAPDTDGGIADGTTAAPAGADSGSPPASDLGSPPASDLGSPSESDAGSESSALAPTPAAVEDRLDRVADRVADLPAMRPTGDRPGVVARRPAATRREYAAGVRTLLDRIDDGEIRKAVLATALTAELEEPVAPLDVLERLRRTYPDCFRFLVQPNGAAFFGAPPERLVARDGRTVRTEALAGSVARGDTPEEDRRLAASLRADDKLRREQQLVVDAVTEALSSYGSVTVGDRGVRRLATIQHLETPVETRLDGSTHVLSLVAALHPTPAVGGVPLDRALSAVRSLERFERGWYAAPVGWFDAAGDGEFAVAIRSAVADADEVTMFAGNGIVADSDPEEEYEEVRLKFRPVLDELLRSGDSRSDDRPRSDDRSRAGDPASVPDDTGIDLDPEADADADVDARRESGRSEQ